MSNLSRAAGALLFTTALSWPCLAWAQTTPATTPPSGTEAVEAPVDQTPVVQDPATAPPQQEAVDVSVPGESSQSIVVTGRRNVQRSSDQVVNVLSSEQIARTGEGNIAGSLSRVTGLSVVGSGYVYVRGLGDRYSLAMLNGSPLPSPEPLKRVVPLDLFPTSVISSTLVQKSYSVNYPGEFGGGLINLTTKVAPREAFITIGGSIGWDTFTTGNLGYTYFGSDLDWSGYDKGERNIPPALAAFFKSGERLSTGNVDAQAIASQIVRPRNSVLQRNNDIDPNWSADITAGKSWDTAWGSFGIIATGGYRSTWLTRDALQQTSLTADLSDVESNFHRVITDNRVVVNGLLGLGLEFGNNQIRWTNLYIHDTDKQARLGLGSRHGQPNVDYMQQNTAWYERQLIDTQLVGEFNLTPALSLDARGGYANTKRKAPFDLFFEYVRTNSPADPYGGIFVDRLNNGNGGDARVSFSDLNENLWSGGLDATYKFAPGYALTVGGAYTDQNRDSSRRDFSFLAPSNMPEGIATLMPDILLSPAVIDYYNIDFIETNEGNPAFNAILRVDAAYAKLVAHFTDALSLDAGVRFEHGKETVTSIPVFNDPVASNAETSLKNDYWLPAATLTYQIDPQLQLRLSASKTIARPQFRELIFQPYFDPESNREYFGNPLLIDSQLYNAEGRLEYYFAPEQRVSVAGFYKKIKHPIESFITGTDFVTSYANAPQATLYGAELDAIKYFNLDQFGGALSGRRLALIGNYTYSKSKLNVQDSDVVDVFGAFSSRATDYFRNGAPLTGQSEHIANLQVGLESRTHLSQQTFLFTYASKRVISRGLNGTPPQPDIYEYPGLRIDFIAREGFHIRDKELEVKFEARNLTGRGHIEYQKFGGNRVDVNTYDLGRIFTLGASLKFTPPEAVVLAPPPPAPAPPPPPPEAAATQTCPNGTVILATDACPAPPAPPPPAAPERG